ncbi:hypothetical protein AAFF_G00008740 [Aldrovandia affinis]|uniref:Uncharacterized protein n=1 Tax=Aldrovandia affinis TaxID=143900 RepID=A0AAD7T7U6_9TELE|nr:hypothetical protein AAFF_G00008740 [Aldrovandia affinis]
MDVVIIGMHLLSVVSVSPPPPRAGVKDKRLDPVIPGQHRRCAGHGVGTLAVRGSHSSPSGLQMTSEHGMEQGRGV